jgi:hypothetical protein
MEKRDREDDKNKKETDRVRKREGKDIMRDREREDDKNKKESDRVRRREGKYIMKDREGGRGMEGDREIKYIELERNKEENTYI